MQEWTPITVPGTKEELLFATKTLGRQDIDWSWRKFDAERYEVCILTSEFMRIRKKYQKITRSLREDKTCRQILKEGHNLLTS